MTLHHPFGFPTLEPAYIIKLNLGQGHDVGSSFVHYGTSSGTIETIEVFQPKVQAKFDYGGDWLYFDAYKKHARLNIQGLAKWVLSFAITGIITAGEEVSIIFGGIPRAKTILVGLSSFTHSFEAGEGPHKELENCTLVGNGRFAMGEKGTKLESRASELVLSTAMD